MRKFLLVALVAGLLLSACSKKEDDAKDGGSNLRGDAACLSTPKPIADPKFPAGFPTIGDVTWTDTQSAGPSQVVSGYTSDALDDLFREMKEKFAEGAYKVAKEEKDEHDAEVNFTSDANDGQVRLGEECQGRRSVTITIRPKK